MLERRGFVGALLGAGVAPIMLHQAGKRPAPGSALPDQPWDMSWLDGLKGKHKQVFDCSVGDLDRGLGVVKNWLDAHETVYGLRHPNLSAVVGIAGHAFPVNASDALYQKFPIGTEWSVNDPDTGKPALRNIFLDGAKTPPFAGNGVRRLQARGAIFWQCNNALHNIAARLAKAVSRPEPEVYEALKAGLNPGVILVPAHTMLIGLCQERGCAYESL